MLKEIWNYITSNVNAFEILSNEIKINGSCHGFLYKVVNSDNEYLVLGTDKKFNPNFILFTNENDIIRGLTNGFNNL